MNFQNFSCLDDQLFCKGVLLSINLGNHRVKLIKVSQAESVESLLLGDLPLFPGVGMVEEPVAIGELCDQK